MDRLERNKQKAKRSDFANEAEVTSADRPLLQTPGGEDPEKEPGEASLLEQEAGQAPAQPRSAITDFRDPGTDDETPDGLTQNDEQIRRGAEDVPVGQRRPKDVPVFDRASGPDRR